jgi:hypothetical protein
MSCMEIDEKKIDPIVETRFEINFDPKPLRN